MDNNIITITALPCLCRGACVLGNKNKKHCPRFVARISKKMVVMRYCKFCGKTTWHIGADCVKCRLRAMGVKNG